MDKYTTMTILLFAVLKEYFPHTIHILDDQIKNINDLKQHLTDLNKDASKVLNSCRFAVDNKFVNEDFMFNPGHTIAVIPPSSGG